MGETSAMSKKDYLDELDRLTVELVYAHAVKPVPRAALAPETRVSLDDMRQLVRRSGKS